MSNPTDARPTEDRPLITPMTILVLSGFLFGMLVGDMLPPTDHMLVFGAAASGVVSYAGLAYLAHMRHRALLQREEEEMAHRIEDRIERHVPAQRKPLRELLGVNDPTPAKA
ncbi:hypothetical protein [Stratiformator vulcanicus]|uniref:Uncharacterized protein n=1 Tax=Stratiformator vulcanicus TaxID=2527980 RepID=A0A517QYM7_9PLAN|nr:hypothetical protein [Stratiformator vulcanicus]QDT36693.1 hypothetical protein Pan189_10550 [Stratiformator vulcanicus]